MSGLQERIKLLQEEIAVIISEQTNHSLYIITGISVLALPVNMIAGLFGMNVGGIPFAENEHGFWYVALFSVSLILTITWFGIKRDDR
jgi:zinc transporter